jgi:hypothetical protein
MTGPNGKVLLTTLWQRTSTRGNEYLSGFLGKAKVIAFRGEPTADGTPTWNVYLQPGKSKRKLVSSGPELLPVQATPVSADGCSAGAGMLRQVIRQQTSRPPRIGHFTTTP